MFPRSKRSSVADPSQVFRLPIRPGGVSKPRPKPMPVAPVDTRVPAPTILGSRGMVASPHHLASDAGLRMLRRGGSAADAVIAANLVLSVVYPDMCGVGGDLFAIVHTGDGEPTVLDAAGPAGSGADREKLSKRFGGEPPLHGPTSVTVPGAAAGWVELHRKFGRLPLPDLFADAIFYAREGVPCPERLAPSIARLPFATAVYGTPNTGDRLSDRAYAATLESIAKDGADAIYRGDVAEEIAHVTEGMVSVDDLAFFRPAWRRPVHANVFGLDVWTVPPSSQGYITLLAAKILEELDPPHDPTDPRQWHLMIEAVKAAAHDRDRVLGDPAEGLPAAFHEVGTRAAAIGETAAPIGVFGQPGDTVYLAAVDDRGVGVSLIQSLYHPWGARVRAPRSGVNLQNRGSSFSLEPGHPNAIAPGRRARSTLSPTVLGSDGRLHGLLGTMGGDVQPQTVLQILVRHALGGLSPSEALASPRFYINRGLAPTIWTGPRPEVAVEGRAGDVVVDDLARRGHPVRRGPDLSEGAGHAQFIVRGAAGWAGAADPRSGAGGVASW